MAATPRVMEPPSTTAGPQMRVEELPHEFEVDAGIPEAVPTVAEYDETAEAGRQDGDSESDDDVLDDDGPLVPPHHTRSRRTSEHGAHVRVVAW